MMLHKNFLICLLAAAAVLLCLVALPQAAHAASTSDLAFTLNDTGDGYIVSGCKTTASGSLIIPATYNGKPVTSIGDDAFYGCTSLTSITIPNGVTSIGYRAFHMCEKLTRITIPDSVTSIGDAAFSLCERLTSVNIPDGVTSIGYDMFSLCEKLTSITIPDSVTSIADSAFYCCSSLTSITIPDGVTSIGRYAFQDCHDLTEITIPDSVISIGDDAFNCCCSLNSITIPNSVTSIGDDAFWYCYSLTSITIPDSVTSIGDDAFNDCDSLAGIWVDENNAYYSSDSYGVLFNKDQTELIRVPGNWFDSYSIPDSVTSIGNSAFGGCTSLTSITIPGSVTSIGAAVFSNCDSLAAVTYCGTQAQWDAIEMGDYNKPLINATLQLHNMEDGACTICGGVEPAAPSVLTFTLNETGDGYTVSDCDESAIGELTIPATYNGLPVTAIGDKAFYECYNITGITIPDSVTSIDYGAFTLCINLTSITIPESVTEIGNSAFVDCIGLTSITIPASVTSIGNEAFCRCNSLAVLQVADGNAVYHSAGNCVIETDSKTLIAGCKTSQIPTDGSVTSIGDDAFGYCHSLTSITIPDSIISIGEYAFSRCENLTEMVICNGVTSIGEGAFYDCSKLASITIPDSVISIGDCAFHYCNSLSEVIYCGTQEQWDAIEIGILNDCLINATLQLHNFEDGICTICGEVDIVASGTCGNNLTWKLHGNGTLRISGSGAMNNVTTARAPWYSYSGSIVRVVIDEGCTTIGNYAFYDCSKLASITIPDSVTSIGNHTFSNCTGLTGITLPDSVTSIGEYAFHMCENLTSIVIPKGLTSIANYTFNWCTGLTSVTIHSGVTKIGEGGFSNCTGVVDVYIEDIASWCKISFTNKTANPIRYAKNLFINGELVTDLTIPRSVTKIGDYAFYGFTGLNSITVSDSLTNIGNYTFTDCNIKKLIIAEGTQEITRNMVMCEATLEEVVIPDSVTTIGYEAFRSCSSLTRITIPDGVTSIGGYAFSGCSSLTSINIPDGVTSISGDTFYGCKSLTSIHIPDGVTHIWDYAFAYSGLTSINIPDSVTTIGKWAFTGCTALEDVYITDASAWCKIKFTKYQTYHVSANPLSGGARLHIVDAAGNEVTQIVLDDTVTTIPYRAFSNCINLTDITIPDSVTSIDSYAFGGCVGLTNITIPDRVASIGTCAFAYCTGLTQLIVDEGNRTYHSEGNCIIETGNKKLIAGCQNSQIPSDGSVTSIDDSAFNGCTGLTSIAIPGSVTSIGKSAFNGCAGLTNVIYCGTQEAWDAIEMGDSNDPLRNATLQFHSFENGICTLCGEIGVMASGTCGENLTWELYGDGALVIDGTGVMEDYDCNFQTGSHSAPPPWYDYRNSVKNIVIPAGVTYIGRYAFYGCSNLESVTIPASVNTIGWCAFWGCGGTTFKTYITDLAAWCNIYFEGYWLEGPSGNASNPLKRGKELYLNGERVKDLVIPDGVTKIGTCAFHYGDFDSVTIPDSVETIVSYAFFRSNLKTITIPESVTSIGAYAFSECGRLSTVTYCGTQAEWDAIEKGNKNNPLLNATLQQHNYENGSCSHCGQKKLAVGDIDGNDEVTYNDAIYLLLHTMFGEEAYPLNGAEGDIDCNGTVDGDDAVYLLLHTLFGDMFYPLNTPALPSSKEELIG